MLRRGAEGLTCYFVRFLRRPLKQLLDVAGKQLTAEINRVSGELVRAGEVTAQLEGFLQKARAVLDQIEDPATGLDAKLTGATGVVEKIDGQAAEAEKALADIQTALMAVQSSTTTMTTAYAAYEQIKAQVDDPATGLQAQLTAATGLSQQIITQSQRATAALTQIEADLKAIQGNIAEMTTAYDDFTEIKAQIDEPTTGLKATLAQVGAIRSEAEKLNTEIAAFRNQSRDTAKNISELADEAETSAKAVKDAETESGKLRDGIAKIYQLATDRGLANAFDARKTEVGKLATRWLQWAFGEGVLIVVIAIGLALWVKPTSWSEFVFYRLAYLTPLVFLLGFSISQYLKERGLTERYAFKAAAALSLESYTELLARRFPGDDNVEQILEFVLSAMQSIYKEPHQDKNRTSYKLDFGNKAVWVKYAADEFAEISRRPTSKRSKKDGAKGDGPAPQA